MAEILTLLSGAGWTIAYLGIIFRGFKDKTYGMPLVALALNVTWEFVYSFVEPSPWVLQVAVNITWFLFDVIILYTYFKYGRKEFRSKFHGIWFVPWTFTVLLACMALQYGTATEFSDATVGGYTALFSNVVMSVAFIGMLASRNSTEGQSMTIAISKTIGSAAAAGLIYVDISSELVLMLGIVIFVFDVTYAVMLYSCLRTEQAASEITARSATPTP